MKDALLSVLLPDLCLAVGEDWYKVIAEVLRVLAEVPHLLVASDATGPERDGVASALYEAVEPRLAAHDLDQEIKECALTAAASLLSVLHRGLTEERRGEAPGAALGPPQERDDQDRRHQDLDC